MKLVRDFDARQRPLDGTCTDRQVRDISFTKLLGIEFAARTCEDDLLSTSKGVFVLLATAHNDKAAVQALEAVEALTLTLKGENCISAKVPFEKFKQRERQEEETFFDWLYSVYWGLPLYTAESDEDRNCNPGFWVNNNLPATKKWVIGRVASIWSGRDDPLGLKAFQFLCDCFDSRQLAKLAPSLIEGIRSCQDQHERRYRTVVSASDRFTQYPPEETKFVLEMIKSTLPRKLDIITAWIKRAREAALPDEIQRLFCHAYVNAGGDVLPATT